MARDKNDESPYFTDYADSESPLVPKATKNQEQSEEPDGDEAKGDQEVVIPEDLSSITDEDLAKLHSASISAFNDLYGEDGSRVTPERLGALSVLTVGIERVQTELDNRVSKGEERSEEAKALAVRAGLVIGDPEKAEPLPSTEQLTAAAKSRDIRINLGGLRSKSKMPPEAPREEGRKLTQRDVIFAGQDLQGHSAGEGLDWDQLALGLDRRLAQFNNSQYASAASAGRHIRNQMSLAVIKKPLDPDLALGSNDPREAERVMNLAANESRLPGGSLVASGGWCAPSETLYDILETESRDGLFSLPTITVTRGGINFTKGPLWSDLYTAAEGFYYTEAQDEAGEYGVDGNGVGNDTAGTKPCYHLECAPFEEHRMDFTGLCITAGLLQQRGFPELIARTMRGVMVAHDHRMSALRINKVIQGSTAVSLAANQAGATAPILTAIELQTEHARYVNRLARKTTLEAVFPYWVHGAIRSDLSRRLGVDLTDVPDSRIDKWFSDRGVSPQFVYNFDDLTGAASTATVWPSTVRFIVYPAGTWVEGTSDIITLDTLYDSVLLGKNDFTALFTEEGIMVVKKGLDSRVVSVPIAADGATHGGVDILHTGAAA